MRIAIVHDDLMRKGGAEKVALSFHLAFPKAAFYTLCYQADLTYPEFSNFPIITSWFQKLVNTERQMKTLFFPLGILSMRSLSFKDFDIVLISTTFCAKYIKVNPKTIVITYCHTPFRLAWYPETYLELNEKSSFKKIFYKILVPILRKIDKKFALRTDYFIANSKEVEKRIQDCYSKEIPISVINPPVSLEKFYISDLPKEYYLIVSRFQPYKKIDLAIEVFNQLNDKKLIIVGSGILENELKSKAKKNIEFKGVVDNSELANLYANCKALIFPQEEDFGITPLEANASGRPVIAYGSGGILETMIPFNAEGAFTAFFFYEQNEESLKDAIQQYEIYEDKINSFFIRSHANKFNNSNFMKTIQSFIKNV